MARGVLGDITMSPGSAPLARGVLGEMRGRLPDPALSVVIEHSSRSPPRSQSQPVSTPTTTNGERARPTTPRPALADRVGFRAGHTQWQGYLRGVIQEEARKAEPDQVLMILLTS